MRRLGLFLAFVILQSACASGFALRKDKEALENRIDSIRDAGAYRCAPKALALAETETEFLGVELERGHALRAAQHRDAARQAMFQAVEKAKACRPEPIAVAPKPRADRDGDGVPDDNDACPDTPGPEVYLGCPDRDGDGIADRLDRCPDKPEDFDGIEDQDGCPETEDTDGDGLRDPEDSCPKVAGRQRFTGLGLSLCYQYGKNDPHPGGKVGLSSEESDGISESWALELGPSS